MIDPRQDARIKQIVSDYRGWKYGVSLENLCRDILDVLDKIDGKSHNYAWIDEKKVYKTLDEMPRYRGSSNFYAIVASGLDKLEEAGLITCKTRLRTKKRQYCIVVL